MSFQEELAPPPELSAKILGSIRQALEEEKVPRSRRWFKTGLATGVCTLLLALPLFFMLKDQVSLIWRCALAAWGVCFFVGFWLYYSPQPRLVVPGYWSPAVFAKVLFAMTALTGVQILLCPSFVFLDSPLSWNPFLPLTGWFMSWGGMRGCMASCGFIFSGIGGLVAFGLIRRTLRRSRWQDVLKAVAAAYFTQIPIVAIQVFDPGLRAFAGFWLLGGLLGTAAIAGLVRALVGSHS